MKTTMYVGIDMAKDSFVAAIELDDGSFVAVHPEVSNNKTGFLQIKKWIQRLSKQRGVSSIHVGVEATGGYEEPLVNWLRANTEYALTVINPVKTKRFAQMQLQRTKTDKVDAKMIADFMVVMKPASSVALAPALKELRTLCRHLEHLVKRRSHEKTYLKHRQGTEVEGSVAGIIEAYDVQIKEMERKIIDFLDEHPALKKDAELLQTIPGINLMTATILMTEMAGTMDPKKETAHAGLAPRENQSGKKKGRARICKTGNKRIRRALYMPVLSAIRYNPVVKDFYERLLSKDKAKKVAVLAGMRKLLHIAVGVLKNQIPFDPNYGKNPVA